MKKLLTYATMTLLTVASVAAPASSAQASAAPAPEVKTCGNVTVEIKSYSSGLMHQTQPIAISGEGVQSVNPAEGCAVIQWSTNMPATSQVIFADASEPINMNATQEHLGFPHATTQNNSAYTEHTAIVDGLLAGKTYIYRVVSRSHPSAMPTVSEAHAIVMSDTSPVVITPVTPVTPAPASTPAPYVAPVVTAPTPTVPTPDIYSAPVDTDTDPSTQEATTTATSSAVDTEEGGSFFAAIWSKVVAAYHYLGNLTSRIGFVIPTIVILLIIALLQRIILPVLGIAVENTLVFWMFTVIIGAIASALLSYYKISLALVAVFLVLVAWYLLAGPRPNEDESSSAKTEPKPEPTVPQKTQNNEENSE